MPSSHSVSVVRGRHSGHDCLASDHGAPDTRPHRPARRCGTTGRLQSIAVPRKFPRLRRRRRADRSRACGGSPRSDRPSRRRDLLTAPSASVSVAVVARLAHVRAAVRFGLSFRAAATRPAVSRVSTSLIGAVAGVGPLGIWTFTNRIFQLPSLAFNSLYIVGSPRCRISLAPREDAAPMILRTIRRAAIAATFVFPAFAAASPELIPSVFGESGGMRQTSSVHLPLDPHSGVDRRGFDELPLRCRPAGSRRLGVGLPRSGVDWSNGAAPSRHRSSRDRRRKSCRCLGRSFDSRSRNAAEAGVAPYRPLLRPLAVALVAGSAGWLLCTSGPSGLWIALAAAVLALVLSWIGLWILCGKALKDAVGLALGTVSSAMPSSRRTGRSSSSRPRAPCRPSRHTVSPRASRCLDRIVVVFAEGQERGALLGFRAVSTSTQSRSPSAFVPGAVSETLPEFGNGDPETGE